MNLVFATSNTHKVQEIASLLPIGYQVLSLRDLGFDEELPETESTIEGNSLQKAEFLSQKLNIACFAEDSGLEISALNGRPGVHSARYAGPKALASDNIRKVLYEMHNIPDRSARFKTVITYYVGGRSVQFTGLCEGNILTETRGQEGFGYDPIFVPDGCNQTFAQMRLEEKNLYSHRRKALEDFLRFLQHS